MKKNRHIARALDLTEHYHPWEMDKNIYEKNWCKKWAFVVENAVAVCEALYHYRPFGL
jgi:hypothetical protein